MAPAGYSPVAPVKCRSILFEVIPAGLPKIPVPYIAKKKGVENAYII
jgi:hypothetical protein